MVEEQAQAIGVTLQELGEVASQYHEPLIAAKRLIQKSTEGVGTPRERA